MIAHTALCGVCKRYDVEVGCDDCNIWFHEECQENTVPDDEEEPWFCDTCNP